MGTSQLCPVLCPTVAELISKLQDEVLFSLHSSLLKQKEKVTFLAVNCATWGWEKGGVSTPLAALTSISLGCISPKSADSEPSIALGLT